MVNIYRIALLYCFAAFQIAMAATPKVAEYMQAGGSWHSTPSAACVDPMPASGSGYVLRFEELGNPNAQPPYCWYSSQQGTQPVQSHAIYRSLSYRLSCPAGTKENAQGTCDSESQCVAPLVKGADGSCACPAGTTQGNDANGVTQCKPNNLCSELANKPLGLPLNVDYGSKSPGSLARMIGNSTTTCFTGGCAVSGTVGGCWSANGVAGCSVTGATFTGDKCDDSKKPGDCPSGSTPSAYAAGVCIPDGNSCPAGSTASKYASGVCIPDKNTCPSGQSPSKYATGVCVPNDTNNADGENESGDRSNCPAGQVASRYASGVCIPADSTTGGSGGSGTTCKDGKCTTTKPDGSTEEETEVDFCKKNPELPQCKKGSFGGSCGSFTCEGDAIQCAIVTEQHKRSCKLFDDKSPESELYEKEKGKEGNQTKELPGNEAISIQGKIDTSDAIGGGSAGVQDLNIVVWNQSITLPFSQVNSVLDALGRVLLAVSFLLAIRIVARG